MGVSLKPKGISPNMLIKRTLVALVLLPVGLGIIILGGPVFAGLIALILFLAAWEYVRLFNAGGLKPAGVLVLGGVLFFVVGRYLSGFEDEAWLASLFILVSITYHLLAYERGRDQAGTDFGVTLGGTFYIGWIGAYLVSLRNLPEGLGWMLVALPAVWAADTGAYLVGSRIGRHKLSRRLSPKKSWEGYLAGVVCAALIGALMAALWGQFASPGSAIQVARGALLGFLLGALTILGDLGESMFKRQFGVKDSGNLLPGHGGMFDRIDSWLWAGVISFYVIVWLF